jgi:hypothetical protein
MPAGSPLIPATLLDPRFRAEWALPNKVHQAGHEDSCGFGAWRTTPDAADAIVMRYSRRDFFAESSPQCVRPHLHVFEIAKEVRSRSDVAMISLNAIPDWPLLADIVAKVENRITLKISRKLIFGLLYCCVAFQRHYGDP